MNYKLHVLSKTHSVAVLIEKRGMFERVSINHKPNTLMILDLQTNNSET